MSYFPHPETRNEALDNAVYCMIQSEEDTDVTVARLHATQAQAWATIARALPQAEEPKNNFAEVLAPWPSSPQPLAEMVPEPLDPGASITLSSRTYGVLRVLATRYVRGSLDHHASVDASEIDQDDLRHLIFRDEDNGSVTVTLEP